jgi:N-acetylglucosaminyldiphosphoundecaprenol N-acetyl-beta-D-mannosaminyltransferase
MPVAVTTAFSRLQPFKTRAIAVTLAINPPFVAERRAVRLLGYPIDALTERQAVQHILGKLRAGQGGWVATHNLDHLRRLRMDPGFAAICATASLRTADGKPLLWAAKLRGTPLPERVAGSDMTVSLTEAAAKEGRSIFLLGGNTGTAEKAAKVLQEQHPDLKIAGWACPDFGFENDPAKLKALRDQLIAAQPDIVYVALGSPKQERLIVSLIKTMPRTWFLGIGISLSFITGEVHRAPRWMQSTGLEWLHRLCQEPHRLARRYLVDGIPFAMHLLASAAKERVARA